MEIVKFKDGKYAVRKGYFKYTYEYLDKDSLNWWSSLSSCDSYCKCSSKRAQELLIIVTDKGTPIKW